MTTDLNNWVTQELEQTKRTNYEALPSMKFVENVIVSFEIDFSKKFEEFRDDSNAEKLVVKAIIPVTHDGVRKNLWLNKANPLYSEILQRYSAKQQTRFNVLQTGTQNKTKYVVVENVAQ